jgi:hypothetical protein
MIKTHHMYRGFRLGVAITLMTTVAPSRADELTPYLGVSLGTARYLGDTRPGFDSRIQTDVQPLSLSVLGSSVTHSSAGPIYGATLGLHFNRYVASELGYSDLGTLHYRGTGVLSDGTLTAPVNMTFDEHLQSFTLSLLGVCPLSPRWSLQGKVGFSMLQQRYAGRFDIGGQTLEEHWDVGLNKAVLGLAARVRVTGAWFARLGVTAWPASLDAYQRSHTIMSVSLDALYDVDGI